MKKALLFCLLAASSLLAASPNVSGLEKLFRNEQFDELRISVRQLPETSRNDPTVLYFYAITCTDPDSAVPAYRRIIDRYPQSKYADQAMYRLGQYYFFKGNWTESRRHFSRLLRGYPNSFLKDDAQYLYCQTVLAQGKTDSAKIFLNVFVKNVRRSPYVDSAILDLESLGGVQPDASKRPQETEVYYSIRVASFRSFESAKNAMFKLSKIYPYVEVGQRRLGNMEYYLVYLGRFNTRHKAEQYARLYIEPQLQDYKIVERRN